MAGRDILRLAWWGTGLGRLRPPYDEFDFWLGAWHDPAAPAAEHYTVRRTARRLRDRRSADRRERPDTGYRRFRLGQRTQTMAAALGGQGQFVRLRELCKLKRMLDEEQRRALDLVK
jgi:hypothetical protein